MGNDSESPLAHSNKDHCNCLMHTEGNAHARS